MARTREQKVGDWQAAFVAVRDEMMPGTDQLRTMLTGLNTLVPPEGTQDLDQVRAYIERVNAAAALSRIIYASDRTAAIVAAMLTQSGVSRPTFELDGEA